MAKQNQSSSATPSKRIGRANTAQRQSKQGANITPSATRIAAAAQPVTKDHSRLTWEAISGMTYEEIKRTIPDQSLLHSVYCNMFYHPRCGGIPQFYTNQSVTCTGCGYSIPALSSSEPLGATLLRSSFKVKRDNPTFIH